MSAGLSLPIHYLLGADKGGGKPGFSQWAGEPDAFLGELKQHGVSTIEIQGVDPVSFDGSLLTAMRRIARAEMGFTFHSHLPAGSGQASRLCRGPVRSPATIAFLKELGASPIMVVHAFQTAGVKPEALVKSSVQSLRALVVSFRRDSLPIRVAVEINRYHGTDGPGVTYDGLIQIGKQCSDDEVGFCWDMGHTQSSVFQGKLPSAPPSDFVSRVIHVHVHDLSPEGDTHWPLAANCPHLEAGIRRLNVSGYTGIFNLELYPSRWGDAERAKDAILRSVLRLGIICHETTKGLKRRTPGIVKPAGAGDV